MAEPNLFHLTGNHVSVDYTTAGLDGKPRLNYQDSMRSLQFEADQIESVPTEAGTIVTVTIAKTVDAGHTSFSVLIPRVNIEPPGTTPAVHTLGITTIHRFSLAHVFDRGQLDSYTAVRLVGTAMAVEF